MRITFRAFQEFHASVGSDPAGLLAGPDGIELHRDRAYRVARAAGDDPTLDAPALVGSDRRRIQRCPLGEVASVRRLGGVARRGLASRRGV